MSRRWKKFVRRTLEWEALEVVRLDDRGYKLAVKGSLSCGSLNERLSLVCHFLQFCLIMGDGVDCPSCIDYLSPGVVELDDE